MAKARHEVMRARNVIGALVFDDPGARDALIDDVTSIAAKIILGRTK